uniref:T4 RNA ligase 1-like N-terminal domain-containing protein n=1 Tax=viral metagenome TaxID=1070528 RepID=A0A6C0HDM6_9ZZZZ
MSSACVIYKISEVPGFSELLGENGVLDSESKTLKLCKTNVVTRNNQSYKVIRYDKNFLSFDLISQNGLLRSVIINGNNRIVSFAPPKSIAWDTFVKENPVKTSDIVAEEFVEGTMINVFWDSTAGLSGAWELATRNSVGGEVSFFKNANAKTFRTMFLEAASKSNFELNMLNPLFCYSFVLQHPDNRIVVPFKTPQLYLVAVYEICHTEGGVVNIIQSDMEIVKKTGLWDQTSIKFPQIYENWSVYDDLKSQYSSMNTSYEILGVVVRNKQTGVRTKLRNPVYENVRHLRGNQPKMQYQYLSLRKNGSVGEFLKYYPEYKKDFAFFRKGLHDFTFALYENYVSCYIKKEKPLLEFADNFRTHMFHIHKKYIDELKPKNEFITNSEVIKYVNEMPTTLQMYSLNYNMRKRRQDFIAVEANDE